MAVQEKSCPHQPFLVAVGCGSGLSAKAAAEASADLILTYHTAILRMKGVPPRLSRLPYYDCNTMVLQTLPEILPMAGKIPVLAGFGAHDPFKSPQWLVEQALGAGARGVVNEPFIGAYGAQMRREFDEAGLGFSKELELIAAAANRDMLSLAWSFSIEDAVRFADAGASMIGAIIEFASGDTEKEIEKAIRYLQEMDAALEQRGHKIPVLVHGHAMESAEVLHRLRDGAGIAGYAAGSSGECRPAQAAIVRAILGYKR